MSKPRRLRWKEEATLQELGSSLNYIFGNASPQTLTEAEALKHWETIARGDRPNSRLIWSVQEEALIAFLFPSDNKTPCSGVRLTTTQPPTQLDLQFGNSFVRVFNEDVRTAQDILTQAELWMSLRQTQFRRAIARFSAFSTLPMVRWMQIVEGSTSLRYEGKPFTFCLFMSKQLKWVAEPLGSRFIAFGAPLPFEKAIMNENWIRAAVDSSRVGLVGVGHSGNIAGMIALAGFESDAEKWLFAPHESLVGLQDLLRPGTMIFVTSEHGDVYMMFPNGAVFHKAQGRWRYLNYDATYSFLTKKLKTDTATSILRMALDLSYERRGALLCVVNESGSLQKMVPDYASRGRANIALRKSMKGLNINDSDQRHVIKAAATADGAMVIDSEGGVLDAACMISDPSKLDLTKAGQTQLRRMPGARSTAAWNASIYGIAIKVSEDGPITIFENGSLTAQIG